MPLDKAVDPAPATGFVLDIRPSPAEVTVAAAERVVAAARVSVAASGRFVMALAGGSTPRALYSLLATPAYSARVDWSRVHLFWGDERCLPPDHPDSNYRMTREALLDHVPIPSANVHRIHGEDPPAAAAAAYEDELRRTFGAASSSATGSDAGYAASALAWQPRFDLILLGMGGDGHTASLFPGLTAVRETTRWVVAEYVPAMTMWRVTITPPAINAAAEVLLLVVGADKAATLRRVIEGDLDDAALLPVQVIEPLAGHATWLVDAAAAARLTAPARGPGAAG